MDSRYASSASSNAAAGNSVLNPPASLLEKVAAKRDVGGVEVAEVVLGAIGEHGIAELLGAGPVDVAHGRGQFLVLGPAGQPEHGRPGIAAPVVLADVLRHQERVGLDVVAAEQDDLARGAW